MVPEHCVNVGPNVGEQRCPNIHTTLPGHCLNIGHCQSTLTALCQRCDFGWNTSLVHRSHNIVWSSTQRCQDVKKYLQMNIATTFGLTLRQHWHQRCDNIATALEH